MGRKWYERELEDFLAANPMALGEHLTEIAHHGIPLHYLGRQIPCQTGIIDLLFYADTLLYVVELKAKKAQPDALGQVLRYRDRIERRMVSFLSTGSTLKNLMYQNAVDSRHVQVIPVIVAPSFDRRVTSTAGTERIIARKVGNEFVLEHCNDYTPNADDEKLRSAMEPYLQHVRDIYDGYWHAEAERSHNNDITKRLNETN